MPTGGVGPVDWLAVFPFDLTWLEMARWPLVLVLLAVAVYFWRRGPERSAAWEPPEPPRAEPPTAPDTPADPPRQAVETPTPDDGSVVQPAGRPSSLSDPD